MSSVRKTLKTLVWSAKKRSISCEICPEKINNHKIRRLFTDCFLAKFTLKTPAKFPEIDRFFRDFVPKILRNLTFFPRIIRSPVIRWEIHLPVSWLVFLLPKWKQNVAFKFRKPCIPEMFMNVCCVSTSLKQKSGLLRASHKSQTNYISNHCGWQFSILTPDWLLSFTNSKCYGVCLTTY